MSGLLQSPNDSDSSDLTPIDQDIPLSPFSSDLISLSLPQETIKCFEDLQLSGTTQESFLGTNPLYSSQVITSTNNIGNMSTLKTSSTQLTSFSLSTSAKLNIEEGTSISKLSPEITERVSSLVKKTGTVSLICCNCLLQIISHIKLNRHFSKCFKISNPNVLNIIKQTFSDYSKFQTYKKEIEVFEQVSFAQKILIISIPSTVSIFSSLNSPTLDNTKFKQTSNENKKGSTTDQIIYYCNFKSEEQHTCPFFIIASRYGEKIIHSQSYTNHNHEIILDKLHITRTDKETLIDMLPAGIPKTKIVKYANDNLSSPKAQIIGENYVNYLITKFRHRKWDNNEWEGCIKILNYKNDNGKYVEFVNKAPEKILKVSITHLTNRVSVLVLKNNLNGLKTILVKT